MAGDGEAAVQFILFFQFTQEWITEHSILIHFVAIGKFLNAVKKTPRCQALYSFS